MILTTFKRDRWSLIKNTVGNTNVRNVKVKLPMKPIAIPKSGTAIATAPQINTIAVRCNACDVLEVLLSCAARSALNTGTNVEIPSNGRKPIVISRAFVTNPIKGPIKGMVSPGELPSTPQNSLFYIFWGLFGCIWPLETY